MQLEARAQRVLWLKSQVLQGSSKARGGPFVRRVILPSDLPRRPGR